MISEIQIYEEKQPNGQWLKSITFKLPIIDEDLNIGLDNDEQVECVALLVKAYKNLYENDLIVSQVIFSYTDSNIGSFNVLYCNSRGLFLICS